MSEEDGPSGGEQLARQVVALLAIRLDAMDESIRKARMENLILTAAVAQAITFHALAVDDPRGQVGNILMSAQAAADLWQKDVRADQAEIEAADATMARLREWTDAGIRGILDARREGAQAHREARRWWKPWTWNG